MRKLIDTVLWSIGEYDRFVPDITETHEQRQFGHVNGQEMALEDPRRV